MKQIRWDDSLLIGVPLIDQQHQSLVKIVNSLLVAIADGEDETTIDGLLSWLREYTVLHFTAEESFMSEIGYSELGAHSQEHVRLKEKVKGFQYARFRKEDFSPAEIKALLADWLLNHILERDKKISAFLKEKEQDNNEE